MKSYLKIAGLSALMILGISLAVVHAHADPSPSPSAIASVMASPSPVATVSAPADSTSDFLSQVFNLISQFGGLSWAARIAAMVLLLIASMKVSFLAPVWAKLGEAQVFMAPLLGIIAGVVSMKPFSWAGLLAYLGAGAGAIMLHEILDGVKVIPGLGSMYVAAINFFEGILGGGSSQPPASS